MSRAQGHTWASPPHGFGCTRKLNMSEGQKTSLKPKYSQPSLSTNKLIHVTRYFDGF